MSESNTPIVITPIPVYGSVTVISPQDQGAEHPQTYHLRESAIVLIWATRQGHTPPAFFVLPPDCSEELRQEYIKMSAMCYSAATGVIDHDSDIKSIPISQTSVDLFDRRYKVATEEIAMLTTAGKLTVMTESGSGTLAGGAQADGFADWAAGEAGDIASVLTAQLVYRVLDEYHPGQPHLVDFSLSCVDKTTPDKEIANAAALRAAGYDIDDAEVSERTGCRLADYQQAYKDGYRPTRLSGLAVTNNPDHEAQPGIIRQSAAGDVVVHSRSATISHHHNNMSKKATQQRVLHSEGTAPEDEDKNKANETNTNSDNPPPATEEEKKKEEEANTTNTNNDDGDDETNCNSEDEGWLGICNEIAKALNLSETATGDDILKAVTDLKTDFDLLKQQVAESNGGTQAHSKAPLTRQLHSNQGGWRMDRDVTPAGVVTHRTPEGKAVKVPQSDVDLVAHCRKAVDTEITKHGRALTPGEYNLAWTRAAEEFTSSRSK